MGQVHYGQEALKIEAQCYFSTFYQEPRTNTIVDKVASTSLFTRMVSEEEVIQLEKPVTKEEIWMF
jgi:hypothetical protein